MAKNPDDRPQTALQLARSLQAIEAEERWALTPLVLLEETAEELEGDWDEESTGKTNTKEELTYRRPVGPDVAPAGEPVDTADPEPPTLRKITIATPSASAAIPAQGRPARPRQGMPAEQDDGETIRRPTVVEQNAPVADPPVSPAPLRARPRSWRLVAASIVVVGAAVGVAVALTGNGHKPLSSASSPSTVTAPTIAVAALDGPSVTGVRVSPTQVKFTWTMANPQPSDRYYWKEPGGVIQSVNGTSVTVNAPAPQKACITVEVDDGSASVDSALTCDG
jgi:hypothetical protein